MVHLKQICVSK